MSTTTDHVFIPESGVTEQSLHDVGALFGPDLRRCEIRGGFLGVRYEDGCPLDIDEAVKVAGPDACIALGCALLAAGVRAREGR